MRVILIALVAGLTAAAIPAAAQGRNPLAKRAAPADPLVGTFKGKDLTVEIAAAGPGKYSGKITLEGQSYPFIAAKDGPGIDGSFTSDGEKFPFLAKLDGEALQLKSGDTVYLLLRQGPPPAPKPANPLERKAA